LSAHFCAYIWNHLIFIAFFPWNFEGRVEILQGVVEDALTDGGFETAIAPSAEEAVTLLKAR
jgi:hypothetical protein